MLELKIMQGVSIIITSYNYAHYISESINSVLDQDFQNWELIIVDDGSTDNSIEIINRYVKTDSRIKLYQHENGINKGLAESIKLGLSKCSNEWVAFLESDDTLTRDSISKRFDIIKTNPNTDLVFSNLQTIGDKIISDRLLNYIHGRENKDFSLSKSGIVKNFDKLIATGNIILTFSIVMVKKSIIESCDFNSPQKAFLDYFLWSQLTDKNIYYLAEKLTYWRIHQDSYINTTKSNWFKKFQFELRRRYFLCKNKNICYRLWIMLNCIRVQFFYVKKTPTLFRVNILNGLLIWDIKRS